MRVRVGCVCVCVRVRVGCVHVCVRVYGDRVSVMVLCGHMKAPVSLWFGKSLVWPQGRSRPVLWGFPKGPFIILTASETADMKPLSLCPLRAAVLFVIRLSGVTTGSGLEPRGTAGEAHTHTHTHTC